MKLSTLILSLVALLATNAPAQTTRPALVVYNGTSDPTLPGLACVVDDARTWAPSGIYDPNAFRSRVMRLPKDCVYVIDNEVGVNFDARRISVSDRRLFDITLKQTLDQIAIVHALRPDVDVGVYPAFIESYTANTNLIATFDPTNKTDVSYLKGNIGWWAGDSASCSWANDQLRPVYDAADVIIVRVYFPDDCPAYNRPRVIQWCAGEGFRIARGAKPVYFIVMARSAGAKAVALDRVGMQGVAADLVNAGVRNVINFAGPVGAPEREMAAVLAPKAPLQ
jgi:hypothetical protein